MCIPSKHEDHYIILFKYKGWKSFSYLTQIKLLIETKPIVCLPWEILHYKISREKLAPELGFEPRTSRFLAWRSATWAILVLIPAHVQISLLIWAWAGMRTRIVQVAERRARNPEVRGSNPGSGSFLSWDLITVQYNRQYNWFIYFKLKILKMEVETTGVYRISYCKTTLIPHRSTKWLINMNMG